MRRLARIAIVASTLALMACAIGRKVDYAVPTDLSLSGNGLQVTVVVLDHRPYVLSGEKDPTFVGLQRSGFGIPFDVSTESGRWLAEDFSGSIAQSLSAKGYQVKELALDPVITNEAAIDQAVLTGSDRAAILEITEWKTDTAARAALYYGLALDVYDKAGSRIGRKQVSGRDNLGGSFWDIDPAASAAQVAREAFRRKTSELFNAPEIRPALTAGSQQPAG